MTVRVVPSRAARADLAGIDQFSMVRFGSSVAASYMATLVATFDRLSAFPEIGVAVRGVRPSMRMITSGSHRILYTFDGQRVVLVRILHVAQDVARALR